MKDRIRAVIRDRRGSLPEEVIKRCADLLSDNLTEFVKDELGLDTHKITVASYIPVRGEISSIPFCLDVLSGGGNVMMPRVNGSALDFYYVRDLDNDVESGTYGLMEPKTSCRTGSITDCDIVIVPAIAYNDEGIRLGQGGGY